MRITAAEKVCTFEVELDQVPLYMGQDQNPLFKNECAHLGTNGRPIGILRRLPEAWRKYVIWFEFDTDFGRDCTRHLDHGIRNIHVWHRLRKRLYALRPFRHMHEMKYLCDHLWIANLFKRLLAQLGASLQPVLGSQSGCFCRRTYTHEPEGFVRAISGHGTVHHSGA